MTSKARIASLCGMLVLAVELFCVPVSAQHTVAELHTLQTTTRPTDVHLIYSLANDIRHDLGAQSYYAELASSAPQHAEQVRALQGIADAYETSKRHNDVGIAILKGTNTLVEKAIGAAPKTGTGSLMVSAVGLAASAGLHKVEKIAEDAARDEIRRNLKTQLDAYHAKTSDQAYAQLAAQKDPAAFRAELERELGPIFGDELKNVKSEDQDIVNAFYNKELATVITNGLSTLATVQGVQGQAISANRKDIIALAQTFTQYAERNEEQLKNIVQTQQDIRAGLDKLNQRIGNTERGVEFMQNYMFGKMSPAEQLVALEGGLFPGMPKEQRDDLEEKIKLIKQREDFTKQIASYLNGANEVANIARNLGVDPKIVNTIQDAANIGSSAFEAFQAFSSGNLLSGVSALSNIFGFGGRDVAAERHAEVMQALHTLYDKVDVIDHKIDLLVQGQEQILKNQQATYEAIVQLSKQVEDNQKHILTALQEIQGDILYNRQLIAEITLKNYASCNRLCQNPVTGAPVIDTARHTYPSYDQLLTLFRDFRFDFDTGLPQLQNPRQQSHHFLSIFWLETYKSPSNNVSTYIQDVYRPALALLRDAYRSDSDQLSNRISSLMLPMSSIPAMDAKLAVVKDPRDARFQLAPNDLMDELLSPDAVLMHGTYTANCHYYFLVLDPYTKAPHTFLDLLTATNISNAGFYALIEALDMTDIAIAQQALLSGDALLPCLYDAIRAGQSPSASPTDQQRYQHVRELLKADSVLAGNLVRYAIRRDVLAGSNVLNYSVALGSHDPYLLKKIAALDWHFNWRESEAKEDRAIVESNSSAQASKVVSVIKQPAGWSVELEGKYYSLPTAEELLDGKLEYQPDLYPLLKLRDRLIEEIASYSILNSQTPGMRRDINYTLLYGN